MTALLETISPLNTFLPDASLMAMLCGAPSWLSKAIWTGLAGLDRDRCRAELHVLGDDADGVAASGCRPAPGSGPGIGRRAGTGGQHGGQREQAEGEGQALHVGVSWVVVGSGRARRAGGDGAAAVDEAQEGGELATDERDRVAVVAGEVDGEDDDQGDLDGLGDVRGAVVRALDRPA